MMAPRIAGLSCCHSPSVLAFQVLFARSAASDVAWTREHLYAEATAGEARGAL